MQNPLFFEGLIARLRPSLPVRYINRIVSELEDHVEDAATRTGNRDPLAAVGDCEVIANTIIETYRSRSIAGRRPVLAMIAVPILGNVVTLLTCVIGVVVCFSDLLPAIGLPIVDPDRPSPGGYAFAAAMFHSAALLPFLFASLLTVVAWQRTGRGILWILGGLCVQILMATLTTNELNLNPDQIAATLSFGTDGFDALPHSPYLAHQLAHMAMPILVGLCVFKRWQNNQTWALN